MINQERLVNEFMELVQVDSETKFEAEICKVLTKKFTDLGVEVFEDDTMAVTGHGAGNLICTLPATKDGVDTIYFTSHMDTVLLVMELSLLLKMDISYQMVLRF